MTLSVFGGLLYVIWISSPSTLVKDRCGGGIVMNETSFNNTILNNTILNNTLFNNNSVFDNFTSNY